MTEYGLKYFLTVLALVFVIEGIPYFLSPTGVKKWLAMLQEMSEQSIRSFGLFSMAAGMVLLYIAQRVL